VLKLVSFNDIKNTSACLNITLALKII
jgi:hypothetical protein